MSVIQAKDLSLENLPAAKTKKTSNKNFKRDRPNFTRDIIDILSKVRTDGNGWTLQDYGIIYITRALQNNYGKEYRNLQEETVRLHMQKAKSRGFIDYKVSGTFTKKSGEERNKYFYKILKNSKTNSQPKKQSFCTPKATLISSIKDFSTLNTFSDEDLKEALKYRKHSKIQAIENAIKEENERHSKKLSALKTKKMEAENL